MYSPQKAGPLSELFVILARISTLELTVFNLMSQSPYSVALSWLYGLLFPTAQDFPTPDWRRRASVVEGFYSGIEVASRPCGTDLKD